MNEIKQLNEEEAEQIIKLPNTWREKGLKEGIQKGIEKGIQKGLEEGRRVEKKQIALEMLREGITVEIIMKVTKLDRQEIEEIENQ